MIEYALVFLLGVLVAGLIWLVLLPAFWRRAVRLTTQRIEAALPTSRNEIAAEQDRLRAAHGVTLAGFEARLERAHRAVAEAKTETGERLKAEAKLHDIIALERRRIAALETDIGILHVELQTRDVRLGDLREAHEVALVTIAGLETQRDALTGRLNATIDLAESRRVALDEARILAERAREAHSEDTGRMAHLRAELQARQGELRDAERRLASVENGVILDRIRGGEETYQSVIPMGTQRQAG